MKPFIIAATTLMLSATVFAEPKVGNDSLRYDPDATKNESPKASLNAEKIEDRRDATETIRLASQVYREMIRNPQTPVSSKVLAKAKCVAVFPSAVTAAAVVGGVHADGVVSCKNGASWSNPVMVDLNAATFGAQLGGKSTDLVMLFNDEKSVSRLRQGSFEVGVDASVAIGKYDAAFEPANASVISYQRSEGAYLGASLAGGTITTDEESNRSIYGKDATHTSLFEGRVGPNESAKPFTDALNL